MAWAILSLSPEPICVLHRDRPHKHTLTLRRALWKVQTGSPHQTSVAIEGARAPNTWKYCRLPLHQVQKSKHGICTIHHLAVKCMLKLNVCWIYSTCVDSYMFPITGTDWHRTSTHSSHQPFEDLRSRLGSCTQTRALKQAFLWHGACDFHHIFPLFPLFPDPASLARVPCLCLFGIHWPWEILPWLFVDSWRTTCQIKSLEIHCMTCWEAIERHLTKPSPLRSAVLKYLHLHQSYKLFKLLSFKKL